MRKPDDLALYYYDSCPFCIRVLMAIRQLGLDIELRNILSDPQHRADLTAARGRATVPVLRISADGGDEWMPESVDIVAYLRRRFA